MKYGIFMIAAAVVLCGCARERFHDDAAGTPEERADSYIGGLVEKETYPGFICAVTDGEKTLYGASFGSTNGLSADDDEQVDSGTAFYAYSNAKIFTACAILQLAERGLLKLDDVLADYLEFVPWRVTIRQALSHSGGIPNPVIGDFFIHFPAGHGVFDGDPLIRSVIAKNGKLEFEPGTGVAYSNLAYALLGLVIEKVTGSSYPEYVRDHIFEPLGIGSEGASFDPFEPAGLSGSFITKSLLTRLMMGMSMPGIVFSRAGKWTAITREYYFDFPSHGGLIISADAFQVFLRAVLNRDARLLDEDSWIEWFRPQASSKEGTFALGWLVSERKGTVVYEHSGGAMGDSAHIAVYPERGIAAVYLTNLLDSDRLVTKDVPALDALFLEAFGRE